jgi:hypothetical protein
MARFPRHSLFPAGNNFGTIARLRASELVCLNFLTLMGELRRSAALAPLEPAL